MPAPSTLTSLAAAAVALLPAVTAQSCPANATWQNLPGALYRTPGVSPMGRTIAWASALNNVWPAAPNEELGTPLIPQLPDDETIAMLAEVDSERLRSHVEKLVSFETRHTMSESASNATYGVGGARDWLLEEFQSYIEEGQEGIEAYLNSYIQEPDGARIPESVNISNPLLQINGTEEPERVYVVGAHYDSRALNISDPFEPSPGANDDASGVALVLEMARICARRRPKATMIFVAYSGEEQGLYGALNLAQTLRNSSYYDVAGNWNVDTVGTGSNPVGTLDPPEINNHTIRLFGPSVYFPEYLNSTQARTYSIYGGWNDSPHQNLGRYISEVAAGAQQHIGMQAALIYRHDRFGRGGDHSSFIETGYPGVRFTEAYEDFKHQHQDVRVDDNGTQYGDLIEFVDFEYVARVTRLNLGTMWAAANAPAAPTDVAISLNIGFPAAGLDDPLEDIINRSKFCWNAPVNGTGVPAESYELVWRPTGTMQWMYSVNVGDVRDVTVDLSKDDVQFGIRSVGADGKKSPAVFPLPSNDC